MIIDESTKTIVLHNPKCGGTFFQHSYWNNQPRYPRLLNWRLWGPEDNTDLSHITYYTLPRFVPDFRDYKLFTFIRNPINRFMSSIKTVITYDKEVRDIFNQCNNDPMLFAEYIASLDYSKQDQYIRNPMRPWLLPQSYFYAHNVQALHFESEHDWEFIFHILNMDHPAVRIPDNYTVNKDIGRIVKALYFDDYMLFDEYNC